MEIQKSDHVSCTFRARHHSHAVNQLPGRSISHAQLGLPPTEVYVIEAKQCPERRRHVVADGDHVLGLGRDGIGPRFLHLQPVDQGLHEIVAYIDGGGANEPGGVARRPVQDVALLALRVSCPDHVPEVPLRQLHPLSRVHESKESGLAVRELALLHSGSGHHPPQCRAHTFRRRERPGLLHALQVWIGIHSRL
ncbi:hypothetical protein Mapa_016279 [Marchantia paleacea]|nr:hypothetical protein Mapa_016279 [Marchantia paleacea]